MQDDKAPLVNADIDTGRAGEQDDVPYAGRRAEPAERAARQDWEQVETCSTDRLIAETPAELAPRPPDPRPAQQAGVIGGNAERSGNSPDADPAVAVETAAPNNSWGATVRAEEKFGTELLPDGAQRDPVSPGVGPLPRHLVVPLALIVLVAVVYVLVQVVF